MPSRRYTYTAWLIQAVTHPIRIVLFKIFLNIKVTGKNHIRGARILQKKKDGRGVLFVVNHTSELDQLILPITIGPFSVLMPLHYVARAPRDTQYEKERWGWRAFTYQPWFLKMCGAFPVASGMKDYAHALESHATLLKKGRSLVVFPEGSVTREVFRGDAHGGVGYLIETVNPIVVPILIDGLFAMKGSSDFWKRKRKVTITVKEPFMGDETLRNDSIQNEKHAYYRDIGEQVLDRIFGSKKQ